MHHPQILICLRQVPAQHLQVRMPPNSKEHGLLATPSNVPFWYPHLLCQVLPQKRQTGFPQQSL